MWLYSVTLLIKAKLIIRLFTYPARNGCEMCNVYVTPKARNRPFREAANCFLNALANLGIGHPVREVARHRWPDREIARGSLPVYEMARGGRPKSK